MKRNFHIQLIDIPVLLKGPPVGKNPQPAVSDDQWQARGSWQFRFTEFRASFLAVGCAASSDGGKLK
jgi:hypothetical protein